MVVDCLYILYLLSIKMTLFSTNVQFSFPRLGLPVLLPVLLLLMFTFNPRTTYANGPSILMVDPSYYTVAYAGNNLWNPGVEIGAGFLLHTFPARSGKKNLLDRQVYFLSNIGIYLDPGSHAGLYNQYGVVFRRSKSQGWFHSLELLPVGVYRSFLPETWTVEAGELAVQVILPGRTYFAPGIGYHFGNGVSEDRGGDWFAGCSMTLLIPYNTYVMPVLSIDLGLRFAGRKEGP